MNGSVVTVFLLFALVFSLAGNAYLFLRFYEARSGLDDTISKLIESYRDVSAKEAAIQRQRIYYQQKLDDQEKLFRMEMDRIGRKREDEECGD